MSELVLCPKCGGNGKYYSVASCSLEPTNHCELCDGKGAVQPIDFASAADSVSVVSDPAEPDETGSC